MNIAEIKVTNKNVSYYNMMSIAEFIVNESFSPRNGEYRKYLQDYAETLAMLVVFTNYNKGNKQSEEESFDEVMAIRESPEWTNEIIPEIGNAYDIITNYVDEMIEYRLRPMANFDQAIQTITKVASQISDIIGAVDVEKLKNFDFTELANAVSELGKESNVENNQNDIDNIVPMSTNEVDKN